MKYLLSPTGKVYECADDTVEAVLLEHPEDTILENVETAYMFLFFRIAKHMGKKFSNYKNADIQSEVLMMMVKRYKEKGLYAPDKSFLDNERIWWSYAKKSCYWLIRQFKKLKSRTEDIDSLENIDGMCSERLIREEFFEFEHTSVVKDITQYLDKLAHSHRYTEMQMGIYAMSKLGGLTDEDIMEILNVKSGRIREIKVDLKEHLKLRFGDVL